LSGRDDRARLGFSENNTSGASGGPLQLVGGNEKRYHGGHGTSRGHGLVLSSLFTAPPDRDDYAYAFASSTTTGSRPAITTTHRRAADTSMMTHTTMSSE